MAGIFDTGIFDTGIFDSQISELSNGEFDLNGGAINGTDQFDYVVSAEVGAFPVQGQEAGKSRRC